MKLVRYLCFLGFALPLQAQWTVYDPAVHNQMLVSTAEEVAKFVEMIQNQVKQIDSINQQVATLHHYVELFGSPAEVQLSVVAPLTVELRKPESGKVLVDIQATVSGTHAMTSLGGGLFSSVDTRFITRQGTVVLRHEPRYRPVGAIQDSTANYLTVSAESTRRRAQLKSEIAQVTEGIKTAKTDAEVQKLAAVMGGLQAALQGLEQELHQAQASVMVQDAANRADEIRQRTALQERRQAEFGEGLEDYARTFRLQSAPVAFPTR